MALDMKLQSVLEQQLNEYMTNVIIKRGWDYYSKGYVQRIKTTADTLTGIVRGGDLYAVVIDTVDFKYSNCSCPYDGSCKHMAAVYFQYCSEQEGGHAAAEQSYFRLLGLAPASSLISGAHTNAEAKPEAVEVKANALPGMDGTGEEWLAWMHKEHGEVWMRCRHSLHALQPVLSGLKGLSRDWPKRLQHLHWATAILFVLEQAELAIKSVDSFSRYYHEMSFGRMAEPWIQHIYELAAELSPSDMTDHERQWTEQLLFFVYQRSMMNERQLFEWNLIYMSFCERLSESREWYDRELARLIEELEHPHESDRNEAFLHDAAALMYYWDEQDELAIAHFSNGGFERSLKLIYPCAAQRMEQGRWSLAQIWMQFLYGRLSQSPSARTIGPFLSLCRTGDENRPDLALWNEYLIQLLPYSYSELSEHWIGMKRYSDWSDLQLLLGMKPEDISVVELREAAKASPEALLPLYHQSVEAAIATRNRQGYRMAVKGLKKLEKLYKATKDMDSWNRYIAQLTKKYQRLRALQEELWRGKIVL